MVFAIAGTIIRVALTVLVIGGMAGAAMYRVLDRTNPNRVLEDGTVVEPVYESPKPDPTEEPEAEPEPERQTRVIEERVVEPKPQQPTAVIIGSDSSGGHVDTGQGTVQNHDDTESHSGGTDSGHTEGGGSGTGGGGGTSG